MPSRPISLSEARKRIHIAVRGLAMAGIAVLVWLEIQRRYLPGLLPVPGWSPPTTFYKWLGIAIHTADLFVFLAATLFSPIYAYESLEACAGETNRKPFWIDLLFVLLLYACFAASL